VGGVAKLYVDAMKNLQTLDDKFCADSAENVVAYFLGAAGTWQGTVARRVKAELKAMLTLHEI
jgi:hypothetical protein